MTRLTWEAREYDLGLDRGVFYDQDGAGQAWNGLTAVNETPTDSETRQKYLDGQKWSNRQPRGSFAGTIEAYTYPDGFDQNRRKGFGVSYRVMGNNSYKIHVVYNMLAAPSPRAYAYLAADTFSWEFSTKPRNFPGGKFGAHLVIDSGIAYPAVIEALEDLLYGSEAGEARLPTPDEIFDIFEGLSILKVTDLGGGLWEISGPDSAVFETSPSVWTIDWPSVIQLDDHLYQISSL